MNSLSNLYLHQRMVFFPIWPHGNLVARGLLKPYSASRPSCTQWCHWWVGWDILAGAHSARLALRCIWRYSVTIHVHWLGSWWRWRWGRLASVMSLPWDVLPCLSVCATLPLLSTDDIWIMLYKTKDFTALVNNILITCFSSPCTILVDFPHLFSLYIPIEYL